MHSVPMRTGALLAVVMAMSTSCSRRLSGGKDDGQSADAGMDSRTNPPPPTGGNGGTGATGGSAGAGGWGAPNDGGSDAWLEPPPTTLPISPREALTRVARVLWEAPPDPALLEMADSGAVNTDADVGAIATTKLGD